MTEKFTALEGQVGKIDIQLVEQGKSLEFVHSELKDLKLSHDGTQRKQSEIARAVDGHQTVVSELRDQINALERKSKDKSLRLVGYDETAEENPSEVVSKILKEKFDMEVQVETAFRAGKSKNVAGKVHPRHLVFKVCKVEDKWQILQKKREALKDVNYFIVEDLTKSDLDYKAACKTTIDEARRQGKTCRFRNGKWFINGQMYRVDIDQQQNNARRDMETTPQRPGAAGQTTGETG